MKELSSILPLIETITSCIDDGVIIFGENKKIYSINSSAYKLLELPSHEKISFITDIKTLDILEIFQNHDNTTQALVDHTTPQQEQWPDSFVPVIDISLPSTKSYRQIQLHYCSTVEPVTQAPLNLLILKEYSSTVKRKTILRSETEELVTNDPTMLTLLEKIERIAPSNANILLQGESGTGKTHIAKLIHKLSNRADKPLITLNCAAIPEALIESELFGHMEATINANAPQRQGRFKYADQGTLLLDEIGEIPFHLQAKLLRAIQDQEFEPVGSDLTVKVNVRIIASSNRNLLEMVNLGKFRADLYYRLAVIPLHIPSLKDRPGDIPLLITHFCNKLMSRGYNHTIMECGAESMKIMMNYNWPGNVRELENAVEHAIICSQGDIVEPDSLPLHILNQNKQLRKETLDRFQQGHEDILRNEIIMALQQAQGNKTKAARELGVDRSTLWRRMRKLHIQE